MALWTSQNDDRLIVRPVAIVPSAFSGTLASAMLVPAVFEHIQRQPDAAAIKTGLLRAAAALLLAAVLFPWTSLQLDLRRRVVRIRALRLFWPSARQIEFETIRAVELVKTSGFGKCARNVLRLRTRSQAISAPLGWAIGAEAQGRIDRLFAEIERQILIPEALQPPATAEPVASRPWQFSLRRLLLVTLAIAAFLGLARLPGANPEQSLLPGCIATAAMVAWLASRFPWGQDAAERTLLLWTALYVPFAWVIEVSRPFGRTSGMWGVFLYFPNSFLAVLLSQSLRENAGWIAAAVTLVEFAALAWVVKRGWKATLAAALVMGLVSWWMSSFLYAGYRM